jgi:hypothetical protein
MDKDRLITHPEYGGNMPIPPGWYKDASSTTLYRYWDGTRWTDATANRPPEPSPPISESDSVPDANRASRVLERGGTPASSESPVAKLGWKGRLTNLSTTKKVFAGVLAVAAAIGTLGGATDTLRPVVHGVVNYFNPQPELPPFSSRTGGLGLEVWQSSDRAKLFHDDSSENSHEPWRVKLSPDSFEFRVPKPPESEPYVTVAAWDSDWIFQVFQSGEVSDQIYGFGRGMADAIYGGETLTLCDHCHAVYAHSRLREQDDYLSLLFNTFNYQRYTEVAKRDSNLVRPRPMSALKGKVLFIVVCTGEGSNACEPLRLEF